MPPPPPPKEQPAKGESSAVREVLQHIKSTAPKPVVKADPRLRVGPLADFAWGSVADIPNAIQGVISHLGDGVLAFDTPLSSIGEPGKYTIQVSLGEGSQHLAAGPLPLSFEILPADPALTVAPLADFDYGTVKDIPATIEALVQRTGDGAIVFDPALDTLGKPGRCTVNVSVQAGTRHRAAGPVPLAFEIRKLEPTLTLPVIADRFFNSDEALQKPPFISEQFKPLLDAHKREPGYGKLVLDPPLKDLKYEEREYSIKVALEEGSIYKAAAAEFVNFRIYRNATSLSSLFENWWTSATPKQQQTLGSKAKAKTRFCGDVTQRNTWPKYASEADFRATLTAAASGLPTKKEIWTALGYAALDSASAWVLEEKGRTTLGAKMHLTVSFGNIATPTANIWTQGNQAIFNALFRAVDVQMRVHMSLEDFPAPGRNFHVFLGDTHPVNGEGTQRRRTDAGGQSADLIDQLEAFETLMVQRIGTAKAALAGT